MALRNRFNSIDDNPLHLMESKRETTNEFASS
jgi:hypothetical protein